MDAESNHKRARGKDAKFLHFLMIFLIMPMEEKKNQRQAIHKLSKLIFSLLYSLAEISAIMSN